MNLSGGRTYDYKKLNEEMGGDEEDDDEVMVSSEFEIFEPKLTGDSSSHQADAAAEPAPTGEEVGAV